MFSLSYISSTLFLSCTYLLKSLLLPVIYSFSFALVNATYKILCSSESVSCFIFNLIASLAMLEYLIFLVVSIIVGPKPISWCSKILSFKSCILNFLWELHKNTTGNSSPLLLWILMILITSSFSPISFAEAKSPFCFFSLSINCIKLNNPLKLAFSYCLAFSNNVLRFACLIAPFGSNPTYW